MTKDWANPHPGGPRHKKMSIGYTVKVLKERREYLERTKVLPNRLSGRPHGFAEREVWALDKAIEVLEALKEEKDTAQRGKHEQTTSDDEDEDAKIV